VGTTIFYIVLTALVVVAAVVLIRAQLFKKTLPPVTAAQLIDIDLDEAAGHLAQVIRCETVSYGEGHAVEADAFKKMHKILEEMYPRVHATLQKEVINGYSLLYTWKGKNPELGGLVFMSHQDVVPVDPDTLKEWQHAPFSGDIADGVIWGRGTLDIKNQMIASFEAVEHLLKEGYQPRRTLYLAFGHDEEIGGLEGARKIVEALKEREAKLEAVIDEGGAVVRGVIPGTNEPVAMVGTGEKGYLTLNLKVECPAGHSSAPPRNTAIGILAKAITHLEDNPMPPDLGRISPMFEASSGILPFGLRLVFANLWLFGGVARRTLEANPQTNASIRTTTAVTIIHGGIKDNILPRSVEAKVNFRLFPGNRVQDVLEHVKRVVKDDRVKVEIFGNEGWDASTTSRTDSEMYRALETAIRQVFGAVPVAPYLVTGGTDAHYYSTLCNHVYRFSPMILEKGDLGLMHGIDERISKENMGKMIRFLVQVMKAWDACP